MEKAFSNTPDDRKKFFTFIYLAMVLALITGVEIVIIWMPLPRWVIFWTLAILSLVKFLGVIWWFMHMRWDRALVAVLFFLGLAIGGGTAAVLWALFAFDPYEPDWEQEAAQLQVNGAVAVQTSISPGSFPA
jgi:cytochrome c oxidase subunit IV